MIYKNAHIKTHLKIFKNWLWFDILILIEWIHWYYCTQSCQRDIKRLKEREFQLHSDLISAGQELQRLRLLLRDHAPSLSPYEGSPVWDPLSCSPQAVVALIYSSVWYIYLPPPHFLVFFFLVFSLLFPFARPAEKFNPIYLLLNVAYTWLYYCYLPKTRMKQTDRWKNREEGKIIAYNRPDPPFLDPASRFLSHLMCDPFFSVFF